VGEKHLIVVIEFHQIEHLDFAHLNGLVIVKNVNC
jgi:hypothetical protein